MHKIYKIALSSLVVLSPFSMISCFSTINKNALKNNADYNVLEGKYFITKNMTADEKGFYAINLSSELYKKKCLTLVQNKIVSEAVNSSNFDETQKVFSSLPLYNNNIWTNPDLNSLINQLDIINFYNDNNIQNYVYGDESQTRDNVDGFKKSFATSIELRDFANSYEFIHDSKFPDGRPLKGMIDSKSVISSLKTDLMNWADSLDSEYSDKDFDKTALPSLGGYQLGTSNQWVGVPGTYIQSPHADSSRVKNVSEWSTLDELKNFVGKISDLETLVGMLLTKNKADRVQNNYFMPDWNGVYPTDFYVGRISLSNPKGSEVLKDDFIKLNSLLDENGIDKYRMYMTQQDHWHPHIYSKDAFLDTAPSMPDSRTIKYSGDKDYSKRPDGKFDWDWASEGKLGMDYFLDIFAPLKSAIEDGAIADISTSYRKGGGHQFWVKTGDPLHTGFATKNDLEQELKKAINTDELVDIYNSFWVEGFKY